MLNQLTRQFRWMGHHIAHPYPVKGASSDQVTGMQMLWWDTIWSAASGAFFGDFVVLYLLAMGASTTMIGTRSSIESGVSLLAPIIGAMLVQRTGKRKRWVVWGGGGIARIALGFTALVPFFFEGAAAIIVLIALLAIHAFANSITMPPWRSLYGDIVPLPSRGRYTGLRMMGSNVVHVLLVPLAGWMIRWIGGVEGYQVGLAIATILGFLATYFYARIPEGEAPESRPRNPAISGPTASGWRHFLQDRTFVIYCLINVVWNLGIQISGPFFSVHMVQTLGFEVSTISMIATISTVVNIFAMRYAGIWVDRKGSARVTAISMLLVPLMPLAWIFARTPIQVIMVKAYGFVAWAGFQVAVTPLLLRITPDEHRSQFIAIFSTINGIPAIFGPMIASWLYNQYGFTTNLWVSAVGRGLGALLFLWLYLKSDLRNEPVETF